MIQCFLFLLLMFHYAFAFAQNKNAATENSQQTNEVESFIEAEMLKWKIPGVAFAVIKNDELVTEGYYGYATLDHKVRLSQESVFPIASLDKQLTATCFMILEEQGKISLDDPISKYLDSLPASWNGIQIKHLLSHTSGLPSSPFQKGKAFLINTTNELYTNVRTLSLLQAPGERFLYSDAGFFLLNLIMERAAGMPYETFLRQQVFQPLAMANTAIINPFRLRPGKVTSYYRNYSAEGDSIQVNIGRACDNGPLYNDMGTTLPDFINYANAITQQRLISKESYELMWTPFVVNSGREVSDLEDENALFDGHASYGYGWELQRFSDKRIVYHGGFTGVSLTILPEDALTIILFTNLTDPYGFRANRLARQIAAFYIPGSAPYGFTPSVDHDTKHTSFIKRQIEQLNKGVLNEEAFSSRFIPLIKSALPEYHGKISKIGKLLEWQYLSTDKLPKERTLYYLARYEYKDLYYRVVVDKKQKIKAITIY